MKSVQLPLASSLPDNVIQLTIQDIIPTEYLDCPEPTPELIASIAEHGVPPIIVCPDTRYEDEFPHAELYYPVDGKRRMKALAWLVDNDYIFADNIHAGELEFTALLRNDLTPESADTYRMSFMANENRSENTITGIQAVKSAAELLGVNVFEIEGRRAIAQFLNTTPQVVGRYAKGTLLDEAILQAHAEGRISAQAMEAAMNIRDKKARQKVAKRITDGEDLSTADINLYNRELAQATLVEALEHQPEIAEWQDAMNNPIQEAYDLLDGYLSRKQKLGQYDEIVQAKKILSKLL